VDCQRQKIIQNKKIKKYSPVGGVVSSQKKTM
jgi:hypothetical protein